MSKALREFTIKQFKQPITKNIGSDIEWICNSMGFISSRDQDKTAFKILKALIKKAKHQKGLTSKELTKIVNPTIGSVIYHLKKLMNAGLVVKLGPSYELRMNSLYATIQEIEKDVLSSLENIKKISIEIDSSAGLEHR
ncbi:MAG: winged helix-turn-helix domain-containing protein [Nanoarchaeota archaeon]